MRIAMRLMTAVALMGLVACGSKDDATPKAKDGDKAATAKATDDKAAPEAAPKTEAPAKPVVFDAALDVGGAVKDADDTRYAGIKMTGPTGSTVVDSGMGLTVKDGERQFEFRFEFDEEGAVAKGKAAAKEDESAPVVKFHVDTPEAVLWESKSMLGGANNHHFVATVKVGEKNLVCKNEGYGQFSKAQAEALLKTCLSATK